jgi:hypothetical protein
MPSGPLGSSQRSSRIGKTGRPVERQASFPGLALQQGIHGPIARSRWNPTERNVGMSLEWQFNDMKSLSDEDGGSVLPDVAERAKKIIPV